MHGQGSYAPQFRHGPPTPPPPFQQAPPPPAPPPFFQSALPPVQRAPPHPIVHQPPPGPPPSAYHHGPPAPPPRQLVHHPPPGMANRGQPFAQPSPSPMNYASTPMARYQHLMTNQSVLHAPPPAPAPPRGLPLPPPPPSQGQLLSRTPHPPPPGIQHVPTPPPPTPSSFITVTPAPFASFMHGSTNEAHPPSLPPPPPPPPPCSPPPLPSPPPPPPPPPLPTFPMEGQSVSDSEALPGDNLVAKAHGTKQITDDLVVHGGYADGEGGADTRCSVKEEEALKVLPSPLLRPEEEVVQNIEALCTFIAKVGPHFENLARTREADNPHFSFLFGGKPGSAAAIGYDYFQWTKLKYQLKSESCYHGEQNIPPPRVLDTERAPQSFLEESAALSPAESDMDMDDEASQSEMDKPLGESGKELKGESVSEKSEIHLMEGQFQILQSNINESITEIIVPKVLSSSMPALFHQEVQDNDISTFAEDLSPVASPEATECILDDGLLGSVGAEIKDEPLVKIPLSASDSKNDQVPRVFVKDGSPFRLIQSYASDDSSEDDKGEYIDVSPVRVSPKAEVGTSGSHEDMGFELYSGLGSKNASAAEKNTSLHIESNQAHLSSTPARIVNTFGSSASYEEASSAVVFPGLHAIDKMGDVGTRQQDDQMLDDRIGTFESIHYSDAVEDKDNNIDHHDGKSCPKGDSRHGFTAPKVDEFGRMVREGASDSDSDEVHFKQRHGRRGRSGSRSRSPQESQWRSHSPWKRREKRSQSRSWSPKRQRSRSKSPPSFRRLGEFARRDHGQPAECFNFLRGRCYRGASCRFLHRDFGRHSRPQDYPETSRDSGKHVIDDEVAKQSHGAKDVIKEAVPAQCQTNLQDEGKSLELQAGPDLILGSMIDRKLEVLDEKVILNSERDDTKPAISSKPDQSEVTGKLDKELGSHLVITQLQESQHGQFKQGTCNMPPMEKRSIWQPSDDRSSVPDDALRDQASSVTEIRCPPNEIPLAQTSLDELSLSQQSQASVSASVPLSESQNFTSWYPHMEGFSQPAPVQIVQPTIFQSQAIAAEPHPEGMPLKQNLPNPTPVGQPYPIQVPGLRLFPQALPSNLATGGLHFHPPQQQHSPFRGHLQVPTYTSEPLREHLLHTPSTAFRSQPLTMDRFPPNRPFIASDYHFSNAPPKTTWTNLPPPLYGDGDETARPVNPNVDFRPQFKPNVMPSRNEFPFQLDTRSYQFHSEEEWRHINEFRPGLPPVGNHQLPPYGGPDPSREEQFLHPSVAEDSHFPGSPQDYRLHPLPPIPEEVHVPFPGHSMHPQSLFFPSEPFPKQAGSFPANSLLGRSFMREDFHAPGRAYSQQLPLHGLQQQGSSNIPSDLGVPSSVDLPVRYPSNIAENNLQSRLSDFGASKLAMGTHYNPFASTFDQTSTSSNFVSNVVTGAQKQFAREQTAGDQYDPLFDSIDPSSNMLKKFNRVEVQNPAVHSAATTLKFSSFHPTADVEESNKQKVGPSATTKLDIDEFGEMTMDAEVGAVENGSPLPMDEKDWSPSIPVDLANTATGEVEIDQATLPGKSKKIKDSRSMKLFKIALADFVKEVLKPSWRQGNMSKEAFKTIVKKTVDKVSGAMSSHQIPKTQAKINQYVESSQRKLTKLVMGYVDKYVKM